MLVLRWKSCWVFPLQLRNFKLVNSKLKPFPVATTICCGIVQHKINEKTTMQQQPTKHKNIYKTYKKKERKPRHKDSGPKKTKMPKRYKSGNKRCRQAAKNPGPRCKDQGPRTRSPDRITCWPRAYCNSNNPAQVLPKMPRKLHFAGAGETWKR